MLADDGEMPNGAPAAAADARSALRDSGRCGAEVREGCATLRPYSLIRDALTNVGLVMDCTYMRSAQHLCQLKSRSVWGTIRLQEPRTLGSTLDSHHIDDFERVKIVRILDPLSPIVIRFQQ